MDKKQKAAEIINEVWNILKSTHGNKQAHAIAKQISPYIISKIHLEIKQHIKENSINNNRRYFDVIAEGEEQSDEQNTLKDDDFSRAQIRQRIVNNIETAPTADLELKFISELNRFDDNYKHGKNESNINVELTKFKPPSDWCKYLKAKGLCQADGS